MFRGRDGLPKRWGRESVRTVVGNVLHYAGYHVPNTGWDAKADHNWPARRPAIAWTGGRRRWARGRHRPSCR
jgi:hypothetical protein